MEEFELMRFRGLPKLGYNEKFRFSCTRCGECCKVPGYFTPEAITWGAIEFGMKRDDFYKKYLEKRPGKITIKPKKNKSGYCTFLEWDDDLASCALHQVKPLQCSYLPVNAQKYKIDMPDSGIPKIILNNKSKFITGNCEGIGKGKARKVKDWVRSKKMADSLGFEQLNQTNIALETSLSNIQLIKGYVDGEIIISENEEAELRKAVERLYGLYFD